MLSTDKTKKMTDKELLELFEPKKPTIEISLEEYKELKEKGVPEKIFAEKLIEHLKNKRGLCRRPLCDEIADDIRIFADEYKPRTNADRVREMSEEELAMCFHGCPVTTGEEEECIHFGENITCEQCILEWLQSEAKRGVTA